jgi:hypothetical protein
MQRKTCRLYDLCVYTGPTTEEIECGETVLITGTFEKYLIGERVADNKEFRIVPASAQLIAPAIFGPREAL